jgi:hypothetical protein
MNVKKIIGRIERMKSELTAILKEVTAEDKRVEKLRKKGNKANEKLQQKIWALDPKDGTIISEKNRKQQEKLRAQRKAILTYDNTHLGSTGDYSEDSALGALWTAHGALADLVDGKGKARFGHLPDYEEGLASDETPRE